jgi:FtsH-binding integral membrane protein
MSFLENNPYQASFGSAAQIAAYAEEWERAGFIRRTYAHLAGAVAAFVAIEAAIFTLVPAATMQALFGRLAGGWSWLIVLGAFVFVSWIAQSWAVSSTSLATQYLGLGLYVVAEAVIFVPLLFVASRLGGDVIPAAGVLTAIVFGGLTMMVFVTRADFSWLGRYLWLASLVALGFVVCSIFFGGFGLGTIFSTVMVAFASGYILYDTSNVLHHYRLNQHVAAALALFASVALLFWYVLRLVMAFSNRD